LIQQLASTYLAARRKGWFSSGPIVEDRKLASAAEVATLEASLGCSIPEDMRGWLTTVGFCTFNDELNFQAHWFRRITKGHSAGAVIFAQDELGSCYAYLPSNGQIVYFARSEPAYAVLAGSFHDFLQQLEEKGYRAVDWVESLKLLPYDWDAV
jgi:hypothetical protein